ncbi:unnamed protein product [Vitrella brassicaformis CCMP3155]|uniref:RRM domain-containing protein n=3 Tax=Vitrella brassicaformis TaxID=1169539 RepID=A0A0G4F5Z2_VITBC|nr:unnamed protein product [Vitrella brassicaformis CCMP3155]|eukprot:CEM07914.1 unnamed protein product [Vitrella brassicaformis CCMP3155]
MSGCHSRISATVVDSDFLTIIEWHVRVEWVARGWVEHTQVPESGASDFTSSSTSLPCYRVWAEQVNSWRRWRAGRVPRRAVTMDEQWQHDSRMRASNVIVNYLPSSLREDELRALFSQIGPIESCKVVKNKVTDRSFGFGFVRYFTAEDAKKAIEALNGYEIENKKLKVSLARPQSDAIKNANLYVRGLPNNCSEEDLMAVFSPHGTIIQTKVLADKDGRAGNHRCGFVRFNLRREAESAIAGLHGTTLQGSTSPLFVKFANRVDPLGRRDPDVMVGNDSGSGLGYSSPSFTHLSSGYMAPRDSRFHGPPMQMHMTGGRGGMAMGNGGRGGGGAPGMGYGNHYHTGSISSYPDPSVGYGGTPMSAYGDGGMYGADHEYGGYGYAGGVDYGDHDYAYAAGHEAWDGTAACGVWGYYS